jgi:hypothetical protein
MNKSILTVLLLLGLNGMVFFGCSSMDINTKQDPQANLANYKTYAWAPTESTETDTATLRRREILVKTLLQSVDTQLAIKGYKKVPPESADFLVAYSAATRDKVNIRTTPYPSESRVGFEESYYSESYREGQLTLDFLDSKTKSVIWEGVATEAIGDSGASQSQIAEAVQKIIAKYPQA